MHPATPLEVVLLNVVLATVLAHFLRNVKLAFLLLQLLNAVLHLLSLSDQVFLLLVKKALGFKCLIRLLGFRLHVSV